MIGKVNDKSPIPDFFVVNAKQVSDKRAVADYFTNIGKSVASKLPQGKSEYNRLKKYTNLTNTVGNIYNVAIPN